jgi:hypothetical protein
MSFTSSIGHPPLLSSGSSRIGMKVCLRAHPALETRSRFRLIPHWTILRVALRISSWDNYNHCGREGPAGGSRQGLFGSSLRTFIPYPSEKQSHRLHGSYFLRLAGKYFQVSLSPISRSPRTTYLNPPPCPAPGDLHPPVNMKANVSSKWLLLPNSSRTGKTVNTVPALAPPKANKRPAPMQKRMASAPPTLSSL